MVCVSIYMYVLCKSSLSASNTFEYFTSVTVTLLFFMLSKYVVLKTY